MRRNIALDYGPKEIGEIGNATSEPQVIYLYTHWGAEELEKTLAESLDRARERWDDEPYLARIIFTDMTADVGRDLTGYGLGVEEIDPEFPTLRVNLLDKTVNDVPYEDFIKNPQMFAISY